MNLLLMSVSYFLYLILHTFPSHVDGEIELFQRPRKLYSDSNISHVRLALQVVPFLPPLLAVLRVP